VFQPPATPAECLHQKPGLSGNGKRNIHDAAFEKKLFSRAINFFDNGYYKLQ
jgi:hypothetical protein